MTIPLSGIITLHRDGAALILPVNPPNLPIRRSRTYRDVEIVNFRTIGRVGNRKLTELDIRDALLPAAYDSSYCNYGPVGIIPPWSFALILGDWHTAGRPVFVTVTGSPVNTWFVITDFDTEDRAGEPGDIYYSLVLREYVFTTTTIAELGAQPYTRPPGPGAPAAASPGGGGEQYEIVSGDTLWDIARRAYGSGSRWVDIYDANAQVIDETAAAHGLAGGGHWIFPGTVLYIPPA